MKESEHTKPCSPGCSSHVSHPCEKCGVQWGGKVDKGGCPLVDTDCIGNDCEFSDVCLYIDKDRIRS